MLRWTSTAHRAASTALANSTSAPSPVVDHPSAMHRDYGVKNRLPSGLQLSQDAFFVHAHQAAVSGNIRRQNCRKPPFHAIFHQERPPEIGRSVAQ
jgi:hypothetical protein